MSAPELLGAARLRDVMRRHRVTPKKSLGQNFVIDPNTIRKVVAASGVEKGDAVIEVGAGAGSLTLALAAVAERVVAIESDGRLLPVLDETVGGIANVEIVHADARVFSYEDVDARALVANLPYNIAAHVVLRVLESAPQVLSLTVMTQREVGERLAARPGTKSYGLTSVLAAYFARVTVVGSVSRRAFWPEPNVDSAIVRIERITSPAVPYERVALVAKAAFAQRRKTLRAALAEVAGSADAAQVLLEASGIDPGARGEQLGLEEFVTLAEGLS